MAKRASCGLGLGLTALAFALAACTASPDPGASQQAGPSATGSASDSSSSGASTQASGPPASSTPPASASALATDPNTGSKVEVDAQGRVSRAPGQAGTLTEPNNNKAAFTITVASSRRLNGCVMRGFGDKLTPERGGFVEVKVSATLSKASPEEQVGLTAESFVPLDAKGKPLAASAWSQSAEGCEIKNPLDILVEAGGTSQGELMLDVPKGTVSIAFDPEGAKGWTWPLSK